MGEPRQSARARGRVQAGIEGAQTGDSRSVGAVEVAVLGKKRTCPRRGACFMKLASYLAGEWWSDDPACTHPLLAALAPRCQRLHLRRRPAALAGLVPSVIGLAGEDLAHRCADRAGVRADGAAGGDGHDPAGHGAIGAGV